MRVRLDDGVTIDTKQFKFMGADVDRHNNVRVFVRREGSKPRIRDWSSLEAFLAEYRELLHAPPAHAIERQQVAPGSFRWLCGRYYLSAEFVMLEDSTKKVRRRMLDAFCERHGNKPFALMEQKNVRQFRDEKVAAGAPEAANNLVKTLRAVFAWAVDAEVARHNPAKGVPKISTGSSGFYTWTEHEVFQFMDYHPIGTKARKALAIMLLTGVRPSDAIILGPQHERPGDNEASYGRLSFTEYKNRKRKPKHRVIPILPELREVLDATPSGHLTYLVTEFGKPYATPKSFGNWFKRQCVMAGLPHCAGHGLRKAGATIAAQNGTPAHALMAIYGWATLKQAETYTRSVNEQRLAEAHMHNIVPERKVDRSVPLLPAVASGGTKRGKKA